MTTPEFKGNEEHLKILKQGLGVWNRWREENPNVRPNLRGADLRGVALDRASLCWADLRGADLDRANLCGADLRKADLSGAYLREADLTGATLFDMDLGGVDLRGAYLSGADLNKTDLSGAYLREADLSGVEVYYTTFDDLDLSMTKGLDSVQHLGPSYIDVHTIYRSHGQIPEAFLRGCGVPDNFIAYMGSLTGKAFEYYSCFISYSSKDETFAQRLHTDLQAKGVRCWFAPKAMKIGDKIRPRIDESIRSHDKLLLILSEHSVASEWVEHEVEHALDLERERKALVLCPIRLDDAVMKSKIGWAGNIQRGRHIGDFSQWKDHDCYQRAFDCLLGDLKAEEG
jgi:hypothetical protein